MWARTAGARRKSGGERGRVAGEWRKGREGGLGAGGGAEGGIGCESFFFGLCHCGWAWPIQIVSIETFGMEKGPAQ